MTNYQIACFLTSWILSFAVGIDPCVPESRIDTSKTFTTYNNVTGQTVVCLKCPPGSHVIGGKQCTSPNSIDHCQCCPANQFQPDFVQFVQHCADCDGCRQNQIEVQKCSATQNTTCECKERMYLDVRNDVCLDHTKCAKGYGVVAKGNSTRDTQCEPCQPNKTYSNVSSLSALCQPCSLCTHGERVTSACTTQNDTACGPIETGGNVNLAWIACIGLLVVPVVIWRCRKYTRSCCRDRGDNPIIQDHIRPENEMYRMLFNYIANNLTDDWKNFIRHLPWGDCDVEVIIVRAQYGTSVLTDTIHRCLQEFRQRRTLTPEEFVNKISNDYTKIREGLSDLVQYT